MKVPPARSTAWFATLTAVFAACVVAVASACGSVEGATPSLGDAATVDAARPPGAYGASACGQCVAAACSHERRGCEAEPGCAAYLACADACPTASSGGIDRACEAACSHPKDPAGIQALSALSACGGRGASSTCAACGLKPPKYLSPLLRQVCTGPLPPLKPPAFMCPGYREDVHRVCHECAYSRCCDSLRACDESSACLAETACEAPCDVLDVGKCHAAHDDALALVAPLKTCLEVLCLEECIGRPLNACTRCVYDHCADEEVSLYASHDGILFEDCQGQCEGGVSCVLDCNKRYPSLLQASADYSLCINAHCDVVCGP